MENPCLCLSQLSLELVQLHEAQSTKPLLQSSHSLSLKNLHPPVHKMGARFLFLLTDL
ncbi:hypothetical protein HanXRQr2_Chr13g0589791 [Helianthus annuus]|uniref:Uncharacterized protein n=1 Tax=Helianthus annuus TaxID=4232 RepID=A0A9K3HC33_HELAN|nr:hypothetical protein HanXRQr2_Chr13g0589791 [Helianthus annuus]KAJ0849380.1 hypothetical protein HanPSC8_Chr13g0568101 [Helianthus annuus]